MRFDLRAKLATLRSAALKAGRLHSQRRKKRPFAGRLSLERLEDRTLPAAVSAIGLNSLLAQTLDTRPIRAVVVTESSFFQGIHDGQTPVQPPLSGAEPAELNDLLNRFNYIETQDTINVAFAVSIRSEVDDLFANRANLAVALKSLIEPIPISVDFIKVFDPNHVLPVGSEPSDTSASPVVPFGTFVELLRIVRSLQETPNVDLTLVRINGTLALEVIAPSGRVLSLSFLNAGGPDSATLLTQTLNLNSLLENALDTGPIQDVVDLETTFFQNILSGQMPVQPPLSGGEMTELSDLLWKFNYIHGHGTITVGFAVSVRTEIDDLFAKRPDAAMQLKGLIGNIPIKEDFIKPFGALVPPSDVRPVVPFGTFVELLRIVRSLETQNTSDVDLTLLSVDTTTALAVTDSNGKLLSFFQQPGEESGFVPLAVASVPKDLDLGSGLVSQTVASTALASVSKDLAQERSFTLVSEVAGGSGRSESSVSLASTSPAPNGAVPLAPESGAGPTPDANLPVGFVIGKEIFIPLSSDSVTGSGGRGAEGQPLPDPGPVPPDAKELRLQRLVGGAENELRRNGLSKDRPPAATQKESGSDAPKPPATAPEASNQSSSALGIETGNSSPVLARFELDPLQTSSSLQGSPDRFFLETAQEEASAVVEPLVAALMAAGVCHARETDCERHRSGTVARPAWPSDLYGE
jgi:hypothetical protein